MFSARLINHNTTQMLNICDLDLLGKTLTRDKLSIKIDEKYYAQLKPFISKSYLMKYDSGSGSAKVEEGFFWEQKVTN